MNVRAELLPFCYGNLQNLLRSREQCVIIESKDYLHIIQAGTVRFYLDERQSERARHGWADHGCSVRCPSGRKFQRAEQTGLPECNQCFEWSGKTYPVYRLQRSTTAGTAIRCSDTRPCRRTGKTGPGAGTQTGRRTGPAGPGAGTQTGRGTDKAGSGAGTQTGWKTSKTDSGTSIPAGRGTGAQTGRGLSVAGPGTGTRTDAKPDPASGKSIPAGKGPQAGSSNVPERKSCPMADGSRRSPAVKQHRPASLSFQKSGQCIQRAVSGFWRHRTGFYFDFYPVSLNPCGCWRNRIPGRLGDQFPLSRNICGYDPAGNRPAQAA